MEAELKELGVSEKDTVKDAAEATEKLLADVGEQSTRIFASSTAFQMVLKTWRAQIGAVV